MDSMGNPLLRHLFQMPAAGIYALADKVHLFNGFELCKRNPVSGIRWSEDGSVLTLEVTDNGLFRVSLSLAQGEFSTSCDCGAWSPRGRCPHLVASLATVKKALTPASFPMLQLAQDYLDHIRQELLSAAGTPVQDTPQLPAEPPFALVLETESGSPRLRIMQDNLPVVPFDAALPPSLRDFLRLMNSQALHGRYIDDFVSRFRGRYPVLWASPEGARQLHLDTAAKRAVQLKLDLSGEEITAGVALEDGTPLGGLSLVHQGYYFDLERLTVQTVDDAGIGLYAALLARVQAEPDAGLVQKAEGFRFSARILNRLQLDLGAGGAAGDLPRAALSVAGVPGRAREVVPRYRLNIVGLNDPVHLQAQGVAEDVVFGISPTKFRLFTVSGRVQLPQPLKAKKRGCALLKACFTALAAETRADRERVVRQVLDTPDFFKRGVKAEARGVVLAFCEAAREPGAALLLSEEGEWLAVPLDGVRQGRLLELCVEFFGSDIYWQEHAAGEMTLERKPLMKSLSRLVDALSSEGYSIAIGGEELQTVSWSFTLDATHSTIDWFELRPEIRCEGELVDEAELRQALQGGGLFRRGKGMVLLDQLTSSTLSLFAPAAKREVVRVPRLQILDWINLRRNGVKVRLSPEDERIFESLTRFESIPKLAPPKGLQATLRNYQLDGYSWLAFLYEHRFGACLADDMGLGKTIQAIALLAGLHERIIASEVPVGIPHLVVVPPTLIFNWESELARFYPSLKVGVYRGQGRSAEFGGLDIVVTSYGVIQRDIEVLREIPFHVIVFDEAQAVKNIHAETTGAVRRLKGRFKVTLTGTPVENHLGEYFSVMDLALPGLLGPFEQFRKQMGRDGDDFIEALIRRTHPFILRRSKDMIAAELPAKVETDIYLEMSPRQRALYARTVTQVKETVAQAYSSKAPGQARIIALTAILKLRQICLCSKLVLPEASDRSPKIDFLVDQLHELFAEGHSVLVFSQFTSFLDIVQQGLSQQGIGCSRLDGSTPVGRRREMVQGFQESKEPSVFLLSLKAGGRGLNLTRASYVFHLDPWWNPAVESQASDRAHRIGQQRQVTITRLLMRHTIEEKMMELKKRKLRLYRALLEDSEHAGASAITREDFEYLLG